MRPVLRGLIICCMTVLMAELVPGYRLPFRTYTVDDGLPQSSILSMLQSRDGHIWFGTQNGVCRFNGIDFQLFTREEGISERRIFALLEDRRGQIWMGTQSDGLFRYDGRSWTTFRRPDGLPDDTVLALAEDLAGNIWIGTAAGACRYDGKAFTTFPLQPSGALRINSITAGPDGMVWFGTAGEGVFRFNGRDWRRLGIAEGIPFRSVRTVYAGRNGRTWIGGDQSGLVCLDTRGAIRYGEKDGLPPGTVVSVLEDREGQIWAGTVSSGAACFDGTHWSRISVTEGLANSNMMSLLQDREGNIWFGTLGGASLLGSTKFTVFTRDDGLPDNAVWGIAEDGAGDLWVAANSGGPVIMRHDSFVPVPGIPGWIKQGGLRCLFRDSRERMWLGTNQGLAMREDGRWRRFSADEGLTAALIYCVLEDRSGLIWCGAATGIYWYDGRVWHQVRDAAARNTGAVTAGCQLQDGSLWFGTVGSILRLQNGAWSVLTPPGLTGADAILHIFQEEDGQIWVASFGSGIFNFNGRAWTQYTTRQGLSNNNCYFILKDGSYYYIGTNKGLNRFDGRNFKIFTIRDGLASSELNHGAVFRDRSGRIWLGTVAGLTRYDLKKEQFNGVPPLISLRSVKSQNRILSKPGERSLSHDQNHIRFEYLGISMTAPRDVTYRYRLIGMSPDWITTSQRAVTFPFLPPGDYRFELEAANADLVWSKEKVLYAFSINPPFWQTNWFRGSLVLLLGLCLFGVRKLELRHIRQRQTELESMVSARTRELEQKTSLLEDSNRRLQELDSLKSNFLSTVSHELRTPLTSIRAFSEILMDELTPGENQQNRFAGIINEESERLTRLINDLLDLSRIEAGRQVWHMRPLDIRRVIERSLEVVSALALKNGLSVETMIMEPLPRLNGDEDRLVQVMTNLLGNAIKFTGAGGRITVTAQVARQGVADWVFVTVADTGEGMEKEHLGKIFHKFYQVDDSATRKRGGTGLGLAICHEIIQSHGGKIEVESEVGGGSRFTFQLPLTDEPESGRMATPGLAGHASSNS